MFEGTRKMMELLEELGPRKVLVAGIELYLEVNNSILGFEEIRISFKPQMKSPGLKAYVFYFTCFGVQVSLLGHIVDCPVSLCRPICISIRCE